MLGSNLGDRICLIKEAIRLIEDKVGDVVGTSSFYNTAPWGTEHPLPYVNVALCVNTQHSPEKVLETILAIEKSLGRTRNGDQNAPRSIDIDIIFYDDLSLFQNKNYII